MRESDEESLRGCEAVDLLQIHALGLIFPRHVAEKLPAQVGDIFAEGERAVDVHVIDHHILTVLILHALGAGVELLAILFCPPVAEIALGIELAAFVVEGVG